MRAGEKLCELSLSLSLSQPSFKHTTWFFVHPVWVSLRPSPPRETRAAVEIHLGSLDIPATMDLRDGVRDV
ncbi:hypothetical protein ACFW04_012333 [Cataglyphis niger]